jgi:very-short-patch-repair endonuclease
MAETRPRGQLDPRKTWAQAAAAARRRRWEDLLAWQIKARGLPTPEREHRFDPVRRWRFDFAWPAFLVAAEVEGVLPEGGRHQRMAGFEADADKYNAAAAAGWCVLRFTPAKVKAGYAVRAIEHILEKRRQP